MNEIAEPTLKRVQCLQPGPSSLRYCIFSVGMSIVDSRSLEFVFSLTNSTGIFLRTGNEAAREVYILLKWT